jgi:hypothetical protein
MINPVQAYGYGALIPLGAGLAAVAQNDLTIAGQWFNPQDKNATTELVQQAEHAHQGLEYLLGKTLVGTTPRVKSLVETVLNMGTEHAANTSPQDAIAAMRNINTVFGDQLNKDKQIMADMQGRNQTHMYDEKKFNEIGDEVTALQAVVGDPGRGVKGFLPDNAQLDSMQRAMQDGKIWMPSMAQTGQVAGQLVGHAVKAAKETVMGPSAAASVKANPAAAIKEIGAATEKTIAKWTNLAANNDLPQNVRDAISARLEQLRANARSKKSNYAPETGAKPQGPSAQQFIQNPTGSFQGKPVHNLKTRSNNPFNQNSTQYDLDQNPLGAGFNGRFQGNGQ